MSEEIKEASQVSTEDAFYPETEVQTEDVLKADAVEGDKVEGEQIEPKTEESAVEAKAEEKTEEKDEEKVEELKEEDLVLAEGSQLSKTDVQELFGKAKELGLNKAQAQAFLDLKDQEVSSFQTKVQAQADKQREVWREEAESDPEIGGPKLMENAELASRAINKFGGKFIKDVLDSSGLGNNKFVIKMFADIGREIGDQKRIIGSPVTEQVQLSEEEIMYGANT